MNENELIAFFTVNRLKIFRKPVFCNAFDFDNEMNVKNRCISLASIVYFSIIFFFVCFCCRAHVYDFIKLPC